MNIVETVLLENIDKQNSLFIFPTDVAASRWADHLLRLRKKPDAESCFAKSCTVAMEKFIAWDTFKQNSVRSKIQNRKSIPSVLRKMFMASLIRENAQLCAEKKPPVFISLIRPDWAGQAGTYAGWLSGILPQLAVWFKQAAGRPIAQIGKGPGNDFSDDDRDLYNLALRYTQFLETHGLFEPAWETPPFEDTGKKCFVFFPESLTDYSEYKELLAASGHVKTIQANIDEAETCEAKSCDVFFYTNARSEITEAALYILALHENQNVPWDNISVSIPDTGNYAPYLFREFDNRNIPYINQSGKPLAAYPAGQFFSALASCASDNFSFASLTALLSNKHLPWKESDAIQGLIKFGIDNNCICSWVEDEQKINVWEDAFTHQAENFSRLYKFFKKIMSLVNTMRYADSFLEIRKHYFAFRGLFFDMEKCLEETDLVLSRCIAELNYLSEIESTYPGVRVPDPYSFFTSYLEETTYLAQQSTSGIAILPYRTSAPAPFDCHIVLGANQETLSAVFSSLPFLPRNRREKLGIIDNDASQAFITLHRFNSRLPAAFFCSEQTFSGYAIPHSALSSAHLAALKPKQRFGDDPQLGEKFAADLYRIESERYTSTATLPPLQKIHKNQKRGFDEWLPRRKRPADSNIINTIYPFPKHILERFLYKGDEKKLAGKYSVSSSSLTPYYKCPLLFIFARVLKLQNVEIETSLMAKEISGIVYHKIINLFLDALKEKAEAIALPCENGCLPKLYRGLLAEKVKMVFDNFPCLSNSEKPEMSMLTARLLRAEETLFFSQLEYFFIQFTSFFAGYKVIASEGKYSLDKGFYYLNGNIDCILEDGRKDSGSRGSLVIVDFKTKKIPKLSDCIGEEGLADFQLPMYVRLAEKEFGKNVDAALFFSILDAKPQVLFGVIQDAINNNVIPKKEEGRIMRGSSGYERIMHEFDEKSENFAKEISKGALSFSPVHWELCRNCEYSKVCRTLYKVFQREK
jgi:hypothetical protein